MTDIDSDLICDECGETIADADDQSRGPLTVCGYCAEVLDDADEEDE